MSILKCNFYDFHNSNVLQLKNGNHNIQVTESFFIWSFITLGKSRKEVIRLEEVLYKFYFIKQFLDFNSFIELKSFVKNLDPSEKTFIAYNLGMSVTRLISYYFFKHHSLYFVSSNKYKTGRGRYDLVSQNKFGYSLFEAKGSTNSGQGKNKALSQVKKSHTVNNNLPIYRIAVIQGFDKQNKMIVDVIDPENEGNYNINITDNDDSVMLAKQSILDAFERYDLRIKKIGNVEINYISIVNTEIGLIRASENSFDEINNDEYFIGRDGIYVKFLGNNARGN